MVASAVYIMDLKGKVIISRNYRGDIPMNCSEKFSLHIQEKDEMELRPVFVLDGVTYAYIKVSVSFRSVLFIHSDNIFFFLTS